MLEFGGILEPEFKNEICNTLPNFLDACEVLVYK